jgi:hypothetical protein
MLEGRTYIPLLHARLAEMRALRELPTSTKNRMLPVIRIRPWLNSKHLDKVFDVIGDAFGERAFALDLDETRNLPEKQSEAYQDFVSLFNSDNGYASYYNLVAAGANRIPVLRRNTGATLDLAMQLDRIEEMERGAFIRVQTEQASDYIQVAEACIERQLENIVFVFDCGWRQDVLGQAANCVGLIEGLLSVTEEFEIVVAGSSFPEAFANLGGHFWFPVDERTNVRRAINRGELFYGDWGSTRRPTEPVPMTNVPRIDVASRTRWTCWRSEDGETYEDIADRVLADPTWEDSGLWGAYMISNTSAGLDPAIRAPAMAAAVRVNLHMHMQANFDDPNETVLQDEPVGDDL